MPSDFKLEFAEQINITKDPVKPIEITRNGVYDATVGGLRYGETVKLKENIDETALNALFEKVKAASSNGAIYIDENVGTVACGNVADGVFTLACELVDGLFIYCSKELVDFLEQAAGAPVGMFPVGYWVNEMSETPTPASTSIQLCTEEEIATCLQSPFTEEDLAVFLEDAYNVADSNGYNPVTVNVPIPDGYHKSDDATATASDIIEGKTAYVNGEMLTGTHADLTGIPGYPVYPEEIPLGMTVVVNGEKVEGTKKEYYGELVYSSDNSSSYTMTFPEDLYTSGYYLRSADDGSVEKGSYELAAGATYTVPQGATSYITLHNPWVLGSLTELPLLRTTDSISSAIQEVYSLDIRGCKELASAFAGYSADVGSRTNVQDVNFKHTEHVKSTDRLFRFSEVIRVTGLDMRNVTSAYDMFTSCFKLTGLELKNIAVNLAVGSGSYYGHKLTTYSLIGLLRELRKTSSTKTLTIGSANLSKLNYYNNPTEEYQISSNKMALQVKLIEITDEMRAEDEFIDEKLPFEVCTLAEVYSGVGMSYTNYLTLKKWRVQ